MAGSFSIHPLNAALGAEVIDLDLNEPLTTDDFAQIEDAFHEYCVLVFREQRLTPEAHIAFTRRFGELDINVRARYNKPGYPEIFVVSNVLDANGNAIGVQDAGRYWHSDVCYWRAPSRCSALYAIEIPEKDGVVYGDTEFANMIAACQALPGDVRARIDGKAAVNSYAYTYERKVREFNRTPVAKEGREAPPDVEHPVIRTHPVTGRKCLFVNEGYSTRIVGLDERDSRATLDFLFRHLVEPRFVYRHRWRLGDLLLWDNCATQHKATFDYQLPLRRYMERTTVKGTVPF
jgi:taurine dioxygenase